MSLIGDFIALYGEELAYKSMSNLTDEDIKTVETFLDEGFYFRTHGMKTKILCKEIIIVSFHGIIYRHYSINNSDNITTIFSFAESTRDAYKGSKENRELLKILEKYPDLVFKPDYASMYESKSNDPSITIPTMRGYTTIQLRNTVHLGSHLYKGSDNTVKVNYFMNYYNQLDTIYKYLDRIKSLFDNCIERLELGCKMSVIKLTNLYLITETDEVTEVYDLDNLKIVNSEEIKASILAKLRWSERFI